MGLDAGEADAVVGGEACDGLPLPLGSPMRDEIDMLLPGRWMGGMPGSSLPMENDGGPPR
jgi:hypothetical protein